MNLKIPILSMTLVCGLAATPTFAKVNVDADHIRRDNVVVSKGETMSDNIVTSGNITVAGGLTAIGGSVTLTGKVDGDLSTVGGDVKLGKGARIIGDVSVVGGRLEKEGGAVVKGSISEVGMGALKKNRAGIDEGRPQACAGLRRS